MSKQPLTERPQSGQADANGIARPDPADEKEFQALADQWWRETAHFSYLPRKYQHVAYRKILAMGTRAVPLILRRLKEEGGWWFEALAAITMENPARDVAGALDQVARLTTAHLPVLCAVALQQPVYHLGSDAGSPALGIALENPGILFRAGRSEIKPIAHAAQKGGVGNQIRAQVGGDDEHVTQRHLDLLTRVQREIVNPVFHGRDKTVEQLLG